MSDEDSALAVVTPTLPDEVREMSDIGDDESKGWYYGISRDNQPQTTEHFLQLDEHDQSLMIAALQGMTEEFVKEEYVYSFTNGGKEILGITSNLVREIIRKRGQVEVYEPQVIMTDEEMFYVIVRAKDLLTNLTVTGSSDVKRSREFSFRIAVNIAERNALRKLIPESVIRWVLAQHLLGIDKKETLALRANVGTLVIRKRFNTQRISEYLRETYKIPGDEKPSDFLTLDQWKEFASFLPSKEAQTLFS